MVTRPEIQKPRDEVIEDFFSTRIIFLQVFSSKFSNIAADHFGRMSSGTPPVDRDEEQFLWFVVGALGVFSSSDHSHNEHRLV